MVEEISKFSEIPITIDLGRYRGTPSIHGRMKPDLYQKVTDHMEARLEGWKTKYLSLAERNVLAQSVLSSIPLYPLQLAWVRKALTNKIAKLIRRFLWGNSERGSKVQLLNWKQVTCMKDYGGLGIKKTHEMNLAFMAQVGW